MIDGEGDGFAALASGDLKDVDGVVIFTGPEGNLRRVAAVGVEDVPREIAEDDVFPRDKDGGAIVRRFAQFASEPVDFAKAELRIDRQAAANGGGLDGSEGSDIKISETTFLLIDPVIGIGREDELGGTIFCEQDRGQGEGSIEPAAAQLSERTGRFFAMADADNGFHLGGRFSGRGRIGLSVSANANCKSEEKHGEKLFHGEDHNLGSWASQAERGGAQSTSHRDVATPEDGPRRLKPAATGFGREKPRQGGDDILG